MSILLTDVMNRANVGVVQRRISARVAFEASERTRVSSALTCQELQGHESMQSGVFGLVDDTHPASPEFLQNTVVRDGLADHLHWTSPVSNEHVRSRLGSSQRRVG